MKLGEAQQEPLNTTMSLGIIPTISLYLLPIVLPVLKKEYPGLQLQISEEQSNVLVEQVHTGKSHLWYNLITTTSGI